MEAHQELWAAFQHTWSRETYGSYQRILQNQQGSTLRGEDGETAGWITEGHRNAQRVASAPDDPEQTIPHHHREGEGSATQPASPRIQHTWQYRHIHCLETVTRPCGCIVAWAKFPTSESPTNIVHMLEEIFPTAESRPSYITIDKACRILAMRGQRAAWFETSRFLVDVFHFKNHHGDPICQWYCNPTPSIQDDPNLVLSVQDGDNPSRLQRAFNTEAAEQLNAWFGGYASQLSHLHPANHDFLVQIMLMYHYNAKTSH